MESAVRLSSDGCAIVIVMPTVDCVSVIPTQIPTRPIWLNFEAIDARCAELGATSDAERAHLLRTTPSSLSRWRRGVMDITLARAAELAEAIGLTLHDIVAASPRPSPPPAPPKPPAGPGSPKPPAGPKHDGMRAAA